MTQKDPRWPPTTSTTKYYTRWPKITHNDPPFSTEMYHCEQNPMYEGFGICILTTVCCLNASVDIEALQKSILNAMKAAWADDSHLYPTRVHVVSNKGHCCAILAMAGPCLQPIYRLHTIVPNKVREYKLGKTSHIWQEKMRTKVSELPDTAW